MTDRDLLEAAAKAAGIADKGIDGFYDSARHEWWNPLTDDGDEARLEATLRLNVEWRAHWVCVGQCYQNFAAHKGDKQAARRYAGVAAAAEIGKALP